MTIQSAAPAGSFGSVGVPSTASMPVTPSSAARRRMRSSISGWMSWQYTVPPGPTRRAMRRA